MKIQYYGVGCMQDIIDIARNHDVTHWVGGKIIQSFNPWIEGKSVSKKISLFITIYPHDKYISWNTDTHRSDYTDAYIEYHSVEQHLKDLLEIL